jgi:dienelactone hydrolase
LFRPDWDAVVTPAVDWLVERPDVDPDRIALMGMSLGGNLAPRAAATEHRVAALIAYDGLYSFGGGVANKVGPAIMELVRDGADTKVNALLEKVMSSNTQVRSLFNWGTWAYGADSPAAVIRATEAYTLDGYAKLITCPTLVLEGENDFGPGQAAPLYKALRCQTTYHLFPTAEGGGEHCQAGATANLHQVIFDWLDTVLAAVHDGSAQTGSQRQRKASAAALTPS